MRRELDQLRDARPEVTGPSSQTRARALAQLKAARARETNPAEGRSLTSQPKWGRLRIGSAASLAGSVVVVIVIGALVLLAHGRRGSRPSAQTSSAAASHVRGRILVQGGAVLAQDETSFAVLIDETRLPARPQDREHILARLEVILGTSRASSPCPVAAADRKLPAGLCSVARESARPSSRLVPVASRVSRDVMQRIAREGADLPGVVTRSVITRRYPAGSIAAQVVGTVRPLSQASTRPGPRGTSATAHSLGLGGLEGEYDRALEAGATLRTSLDVRLQAAAEQALRHAVASNPPATGGAFVAMNPQNGQIYALGSLPGTRTGTPTPSGVRSGAGGLDQAIASAGATGSIVTPITAMAALQSDSWTTGSVYDDTGAFKLGALTLHNPGGVANGPLDMVNALRVSSQTFFYDLGARTNVANPFTHPKGGALQTWARQLGLGQLTGIDLPGEIPGTLPTPASRQRQNRLESQCDTATGPFTGKAKHHPGGCGIADGTNRPWSIGDNINLAVGQGNIQATPIQLAVSYAALANGGDIVKPHIGLSLQRRDGTLLRRLDQTPARHLTINPRYLDVVRQGMRKAASAPGGTSAPVFAHFTKPVYGIAGAAQYNGQSDYAWYACYVPATATSKPIVVVVHVDQGGFGAVSAAPVARQILSQWFFGKPGPYLPGSSHTL